MPTQLGKGDRTATVDDTELTFAGVANVDQRDRVRLQQLFELGDRRAWRTADEIGQRLWEGAIGVDREIPERVWKTTTVSAWG